MHIITGLWNMLICTCGHFVVGHSVYFAWLPCNSCQFEKRSYLRKCYAL